MANIDVNKIGKDCMYEIKKQPWFPYKTGNLKNKATIGRHVQSNIYEITFDSNVAPYVAYLEEGTQPHDIPRAFGRPLPFGIGGRFNGKFHSGSTKHKGFISNKSVNAIIEHIKTKYHGEVRK